MFETIGVDRIIKVISGAMKHKSTAALYLLIAFLILIATTSLNIKLLDSDPALYANVAKESFLRNDWANLTYLGQDWLDKPHFPFWMTILSFKIFGINVFAYLLPGLAFGMIGAIYFYKLNRLWVNQETALIAVIMYLSTRNIIIYNSMDIRAEAYLLGSIIPACYYWLQYYRNTSVNTLIKGAIFSAIALMTKGIFFIIPITSGLIFLMWQQQQLRQMISRKSIIAIITVLICIMPELICLYIQFDMHPEKIVFGHNHVSGIWWFFWGSQFGRFLDIGPIHQDHTNHFDFLAALPDLLLPWTFAVVISIIMVFSKKISLNPREKEAFGFALASFIPTFILFSISRFHQLHYIVILLPFLYIISAIVFTKQKMLHYKYIIAAQYLLAFVLTAIAYSGIVSSTYLGNPIWPILIIVANILIMLALMFVKLDKLYQVIIISAISGSFLFLSTRLEYQISRTNFNQASFFTQFIPNNQSETILIEPNQQFNIPLITFIAKQTYTLSQININQYCTKSCLIITTKKYWQTMEKNNPHWVTLAIYSYTQNYGDYKTMIEAQIHNHETNPNSLILVKITHTASP